MMNVGRVGAWLKLKNQMLSMCKWEEDDASALASSAPAKK